MIHGGRARTRWQDWSKQGVKWWRMRAEEARGQIMGGLVTMVRHFDVILSKM